MDLLTDALAVYRLTRLVTADSITRRPRTAIVENPATPAALAELIECPWCVSFWIGAGVVVASQVAPRTWRPISRALAFSAVAGLLSTHGE